MHWLQSIHVTSLQTFHPKKKYILGLGPGCGPKSNPKTKIDSELNSIPKHKTKINSEFNSLHFGKEINKSYDKCLTFLRILKKNFLVFFSHFLDPKTYGC